MNEMMTFPDTWEEFEKSYGFTDSEEAYTNGARLIPSFRVKQWLDHLSSEEPQKWIPVSERLPKNGTSVLFCDDEGDIYNGYCLVRDGGRYHKWMEYHNADRIKNVVAWMYWPDPYKGEEE